MAELYLTASRTYPPGILFHHDQGSRVVKVLKMVITCFDLILRHLILVVMLIQFVGCVYHKYYVYPLTERCGSSLRYFVDGSYFYPINNSFWLLECSIVRVTNLGELKMLRMMSA